MHTKDILTNETESIKDVFKQLDKTAEKVLLVVDKKKRLLGTITDGDIRRYILKGKSMENTIEDVYNKKPFYMREEEFSVPNARNLLIKKGIDLIPILNNQNIVVSFITWGQAFSEKRGIVSNKKRSLDIPVVIMAGGKGRRLEPLSRILPKPLIPIGEKPIIEIIIDEFKCYGIKKFYLTLNYKGKMIESYFDSIEKNYKLEYMWDKETSGTAGSLKLLEKDIGDTFIVSNCDVIVKANFSEVVNFHKHKAAALTILSSIQHHKIPYGVINIHKTGEVNRITEKPEYTFIVNTGVYIMDKRALRYVPRNSDFNMTDLISVLIRHKEKILTYPVNESDYIDIGQWEEFKKNFQELSKL